MNRRANALAVVFLLLGVVCAAGPAWAADADIVVTSVSVPEANQVLIKANATFTAKASSPDKFIVFVDIRSAAVGADVQPTMAGQGIIKSVEVKSLKDLTPTVVRIVINLNQEVIVEMAASEGGALVKLAPKVGGETATAEPEEVILPYEETRAEVERLMTGAPPAAFAPLPAEYQPVETHQTGLSPILTAMPPAGPGGEATVVGDIYYRTLPDGVQILIRTNGQVGSFTDYDSSRPARLYVELPGLSSVAPQRVYNLRWGGVSDISVNKKGNKVVVGIDFSGGLKAYYVQRTSSGIVVTVYKAKYTPGGLSSQRIVTQQGDSLASISQQAYGSPDGWRRIMSANRDAFTSRERAAIERSNGTLELGSGLPLNVPNR